MIKAPNFAEVISNVIICQHNLSDLAIAIEALSDNKFVTMVFQAWLSPIKVLSIPSKHVSVVLFFMHQTLDAAILPHSICKSAALPKGQIATSGAYF